MQYKNPVDIELVNAANEAHEVLSYVCERLGVSQDSGLVLRLKNATEMARVEMTLQAEADRNDIVSPLDPPGSMD
jgi:hypothetical protein